MKKRIAFLLALACLLSLCACHQEAVSSKDEYVTVYLPSEKIFDDGRTEIFTYDENGNLIEEVTYHNGVEGGRHTYTYDSNNHMLGEIFYNYGIEYRRDSYVYDENGNLTEYVCFLAATTNLEGCLAHGDTTDRDTYTYDEDGRLIEENHYSNGKEQSKYTYIYDSQTNRRYKYTYSKRDTGYEPNGIEVEIFDDQGRVIRSEYYHSDDKDRLDEAAPYTVCTYTYAGENLMEQISYREGKVDYYWTFDYNTQGDVIKRTYVHYNDRYGDSSSVQTYEYTYDTAGNITQYKQYTDGKHEKYASYSCIYIAVKMTRQQAEEFGYI